MKNSYKKFASKSRTRNLHEIEHALFDARNSREKNLAASRYDTRTSFSNLARVNSHEFLVRVSRTWVMGFRKPRLSSYTARIQWENSSLRCFTTNRQYRFPYTLAADWLDNAIGDSRLFLKVLISVINVSTLSNSGSHRKDIQFLTAYGISDFSRARQCGPLPLKQLDFG